ncbi:MAG: histidine kinase [Syntrophorhabdaceae bacterium]|nr:histidine kinase [Syntrophorhabdaceae bacterium]
MNIKDKTRKQLLPELTTLRNRVVKLRESAKEFRRFKRFSQQQTHDLGERVKELNCLYAISNLVERHGISLEKILHETVNIIPSAWQYPEITGAKITLGDQIFLTENFQETPWTQSADILVKRKKMGFLEVCYLKKKPKSDEGPFLKEERNLINVIAKRIGEIIERKIAEDALKESTTRNKALLNAIPDLIFRISRDGTILDLKKGKSFGQRLRTYSLPGKNVQELPDYFKVLPREIVLQGMKNVSHVLQTGETQIYEHRFSYNDTVFYYEVLLTESGGDEVLGIIRDITERRHLEKQVLEISEWEQQRIGQDLHDSLCQQLAGIAFLGKVLEQKMDAQSYGEARDAAEIVSLIDDAITQTKGLARGLYPVRLEATGLMAALTELSHTVQKFFGINCSFSYDRPVLIHDNIMAIHLYRIAQEAVNNAIKHGKANNIRITFTNENGATVLMIKNDGVCSRRMLKNNTGMGISIMRHRANMIGASLEIKSNPAGGTVVACSFQSRQRAKKRGKNDEKGKRDSFCWPEK